LRVSRTGAPTLWRSPRQFPLLSICGQGAQRLRRLHLTRERIQNQLTGLRKKPYEKIWQVDREAGRCGLIPRSLHARKYWLLLSVFENSRTFGGMEPPRSIWNFVLISLPDGRSLPP
jgi:hypothetical protein